MSLPSYQRLFDIVLRVAQLSKGDEYLNTIIAVIAGVIGGLLGAVPFYAARKKAKAKLKTDGVGGIMIGLVATVVSFLIMVVELVICSLVARDYLLPFAISVIVVFILAMAVYTAILMRK